MINEAGKYRAKAKGWQLGEASNGSAQVGIMFDLLDHPGETFTYYGSFSGGAFEHTMKGLRACGWQGTDIMELADPATKMDNEVSLVIDWDEYNGETKLKAKWINPLGLGMKKPLEGDSLRAFAAQLKGQILAFDASNGNKKPAPAKKQDIPF